MDGEYSISTLAIVSRQEGGMSLTIDELCQSSCYRRRTSDAAPARSHHTGLGAFCTTLFAPGLAPCPALLLRAILTPGTRTVTATLRIMGLATERRFTNYHRVLNWATWSGRCPFCRRSAGWRRGVVLGGIKREAFELLLTGLPLRPDWPKSSINTTIYSVFAYVSGARSDELFESCTN